MILFSVQNCNERGLFYLTVVHSDRTKLGKGCESVWGTVRKSSVICS